MMNRVSRMATASTARFGSGKDHNQMIQTSPISVMARSSGGRNTVRLMIPCQPNPLIMNRITWGSIRIVRPRTVRRA